MTLPAFDPNSPTFHADTQDAARAKIRQLLASDHLSVFGFATSSLRGVPIQAVALDGQGEVLQQTFIRTAQPLDPESQAYHGVQQADVDHARPLNVVLPTLTHVLNDCNDVITFSPDFMRQALIRVCRQEGVEMFGTGHWVSGQDLLATLTGTYNWTTGRWSRPRLADCCQGVTLPAHFAPMGTALGNAQRLLQVLRHHVTDHGKGTAAVGRCEQCGLALDECRCFHDPNEADW